MGDVIRLHPEARSELLPEEGLDLVAELEAYERDLLVEALERTGSVRAAGRLLRLSERAMYGRCRRAGDILSTVDHWHTTRAEALEVHALARVGYTRAEIVERTGLSSATVHRVLTRGDDEADRAAEEVGA